MGVYYLPAEDMAVALDRVAERGMGIRSLEVWLNGERYDGLTCEELHAKPGDESWYRAAFESLRRAEPRCRYAVVFYLPESVMRGPMSPAELTFRPYWEYPQLALVVLFMGLVLSGIIYAMVLDRSSLPPSLLAFIAAYCLLALGLLLAGQRRVRVVPERRELVLSSPFSKRTIAFEEVKNLLRSVSLHRPPSYRSHPVRCASYHLHLRDGRLIPLVLHVLEVDIMKYGGSKEHRTDLQFVRLAGELGLEAVYFDLDWKHRDNHELRPELLSYILDFTWGQDAELAAKLEARMLRDLRRSKRHEVAIFGIFGAFVVYGSLLSLLQGEWLAVLALAIGLLILYLAVDSFRELLASRR